MKYDRAINALEKVGLVERVVQLGRVTFLEIVSLIQHYKGDEDFEGSTRDSQVDTLLVALILKVAGPATTEEILERCCVLATGKIRGMIKFALDESHFPRGTHDLIPNTTRTLPEGRMYAWNQRHTKNEKKGGR